MGIWVPKGDGDFLWRKSNTEGTQPARAYGTLITIPGTANTKGSYATCLSALAFDCYGIWIRANDIFNSNGTPCDTLLDIGVDPAGGTSFSVVIPDLLYSSNTSTLLHAHPLAYYFPLWIRAGSSIGARAQSVLINNTFNVEIRVVGKPRDPKSVKAGTYVNSFGVVTASSTGTAVTSGTTSEGAWTQIGSNTTKDYWWFQHGQGVTSGSMLADNIYASEVGVGNATPQLVIQDQLWSVSASNSLSSDSAKFQGAYYSKTGDGIYVRSQCSATPDTGITYAAYALGG